MESRPDPATAQDAAEIAAARAARHARDAEQSAAERLVRLDSLIRELTALKEAGPER